MKKRSSLYHAKLDNKILNYLGLKLFCTTSRTWNVAESNCFLYVLCEKMDSHF